MLKLVAQADQELMNGEVCLFNIPKEAITSIYIGASASEEFEEKILDSLNKHQLDIEVRKIVLNPENYELNSISYNEWLDVKEPIKQDGALEMLNDVKQWIRTTKNPSK